MAHPRSGFGFLATTRRSTLQFAITLNVIPLNLTKKRINALRIIDKPVRAIPREEFHTNSDADYTPAHSLIYVVKVYNFYLCA